MIGKAKRNLFIPQRGISAKPLDAVSKDKTGPKTLPGIECNENLQLLVNTVTRHT